MWDRIFLHSNSPASQWAPLFLFLLELLRRASEALRKESRFSELIQRLVNMPFRDLCRGNGACRTIEEARRCGAAEFKNLPDVLDKLGYGLVYFVVQYCSARALRN